MSRVRDALLGPVLGAFRAARRYPGWVVGGLGAVLCVLGWYGVSGERYAARQLPYLASATAPGVALIVAGAVLVAGRSRPGADEESRRRIAELHELLTEAVREPADAAAAAAADPAGAPAYDGMPLAVPQGRTYHRPGCALVSGKPEARPVDAAAVRERELHACPVCEPDAPAEP